MKTVGADDESGGQPDRFAIAFASDIGMVAFYVVQRRIGDVEPDFALRRQARRDQILDDLMLRIDGDRAAGQRGQIDAVTLTVERQLDAVMQRAFGLHALAEAGRDQDVHRVLFQHAGADSRFDIGARAGFQHHGFDALQMQ